jgi:cell division protein FtsN
MGRARRRAAAAGAALRKFFVGSALVAVGVCLGIVLGTVWDLPELLLRRLLEAPRTVALTPPEPRAVEEPLAAFRELQSKSRRKRSSEPVARAPAPRERPQPAERREQPAPAAVPAPTPAPASAPEAPSAADRALADVAARAVSRSAPGRQVVIQVASYTDQRSAEALVTRLRRSGFDSYLSHTKPEGETRYRVRVRPSGDTKPADLAGKLQASGFSTWITTE